MEALLGRQKGIPRIKQFPNEEADHSIGADETQANYRQMNWSKRYPIQARFKAKREVFMRLTPSVTIGVGLYLIRLVLCTGYPEATVVLAMLGKTLICITYSVLYVFANELFPTEVRNVGVGTASMCARLSSMSASFVGGPLVGSTSSLVPVITVRGSDDSIVFSVVYRFFCFSVTAIIPYGSIWLYEIFYEHVLRQPLEPY